MTKLAHRALTSHSTKQVTCFELVMKRDRFNWSSSAKGKIAPAVLLKRQNRHCQIYWQILHPEKTVMWSTVLQVGWHKSPWLFGGKTLGLQCSTDADRVMYNKCGQDADRSCWCSADSGHKFSVHAISSLACTVQHSLACFSSFSQCWLKKKRLVIFKPVYFLLKLCDSFQPACHLLKLLGTFWLAI